MGDERRSIEIQLSPGEVFSDGSGLPEMVVVPAGQFVMGSPPQELLRGPDDSEDPLHLVTFTAPFAIGRFAVTLGEFDAFVTATGHAVPDWLFIARDEVEEWIEHPGHSFRNPGFEQSARHPVVGVTFADAVAYAAWLTRITGRRYHLPSEAQWEYAARGGTTTPFWWGATISTDQANYNGCHIYGDGMRGLNRRGTVPVDSFAANPFGLFQMHGNVWEWCADCWHPSHAGAPVDGSPRTDGDPEVGVLRGGSWLNGPWVLRAAKRMGDPRAFRHNSFGFRVARAL
jgi:formylglycine-generating enzyme required for sulfatase activity